MEYQIIHLSKEMWKEKECNFPDKLYENNNENAYAWGVLAEEELVAALETDQDVASKCLRITQLWVSKKYQNQGIEYKLVEIAKEQARRERCKVVIIEINDSKVKAIDVYQQEGFSQIDINTCCDKDIDLQRKDANLKFLWLPEEKKKLKREEIEIRMETKDDWYHVELMTQHAFWNKHQLGCDEHYLVHKLRQDQDYLPEISRIALKDGEVIGCIMYSKAKVIDGTHTQEIITFGPLSVEPKWQGCGVGELLLRETMQLAVEKGYRVIVIFGEPDYYPRIGFKTCDNFNITTAEGKNTDAFMGIELVADGMKNIKGKFYESKVFENLGKEEVEEYNKNFPHLQKLRFPGQWS